MRKIKYITGSFLILILMIVTSYVGYRLAFRNLIFPKILISGINVTGMDKTSAEKLIKTYFEANPSEITLVSNGKTITKLDSRTVTHDIGWSVEQAYLTGRNGNFLTQITEQFHSLRYGREINVPFSYDKEDLDNLVGQLATDLNTDPVWPKLAKQNDGIKLIEGKNGIAIKTDDLTKEILKQFSYPGLHSIEIPTDIINTAANQKMVEVAKAAINSWGDKTLSLQFRDYQRKLSPNEMIGLFGLVSDLIDKNKLNSLVQEIKPQVETDPRDAIFVFENEKVQEFKPEVIGAQVDEKQFEEKLAENLISAKDNVMEIPMVLTYPKVKAGDINNLGIKELIGTGKSTFFHSIPGRVFNVNLAAARVNGTLVAPGEEFSFNKAVGEISKATGYQQAYVISEGRTVLGDGGGVCQVSTTTFRAALDAGLPITERKAHAYRVGYYEQDSAPGIDATVFSPSADLKFLNDTGHYILVQEFVDTKKLTMRVDIYGTSDGRKSTITKPRISNQTPPPPTLYVDDPTLPTGTMKQVDWSAWGAKVAFDYSVVRNGETIYQKTFVSNYQPWQAIYMRGTGSLASN